MALQMASILHRLGCIEKGHLVSVTRDDLVGQYVGHTAPKTKDVVKRAYGGVLFIDEAYYLHRQENERDYGQEAVEVLLQVMESERQNLVVVMAGYQDRMEEFFQANPAIWERMHFVTHLRARRLGEFTIGTDHRSESLALVQLLILYHLVTAKAAVALGGSSARNADGVPRASLTA